MKRRILTVVLLGVVSLASMAYGQSGITQTTLSAAMGATDLNIKLASGSNITPAQNSQPVTLALIGQEVVGVLYQQQPFSQNFYSVVRGVMGTKAMAHPSGDMVLVQQVRGNGAGAFSSPALGGFQTIDPPIGGTCSGNLWVDVLTTAQWLCSSVTGTWVPGWHNPLAASVADRKVTAAVASAAGLITPSGPLFHITGTAAITGFNIPVGFNATAVGGGGFCAIPDGAFTTTTANNIALASTAVVNKPLCWIWDATNQKFTPSY